MAPEQALGEKLDPRVDLFALGVVMYEMLAGGPPFDGSVHEVVLANIKKDPAPIANVDPNLDRFARKLMARNLDHRIASARAAIELLALIDSDPAAAALALGQTDVVQASAIIALPALPDRTRSAERDQVGRDRDALLGREVRALGHVVELARPVCGG